MKAAEKRRFVWGDALVALILLAAAFIVTVTLPFGAGDGLTVVVTVDGETVLTCPLDKVTQTTLYSPEGEYPLTLELSPEGVRVLETACPGEDCRHMGVISSAGQQIVCLPNRLVVSLQGGEPSVDAVTG